MRLDITPDFVAGEKGNAAIYISQRNVDMILQYNGVFKGLRGLGGIEILVEPNEVHYSEESEKKHQLYTDDYLYGDKAHPYGIEKNV